MQKNFDRFAIILSGLCAVHCIAVPLAVSLFPFLSLSLEHGDDTHELLFHQIIVFIIIPTSLIALSIGFITHKRWLPTVIATVGLVILLIPALFFEALENHQLINHDDEIIITLLGGCIHAIGHVLNAQATRQSHHVTNTL